MSDETSTHESKNLDKLLSLRGKPFADWKEERKYLRDKWGMQGKEVDYNSDEESREIIFPRDKEES